MQTATRPFATRAISATPRGASSMNATTSCASATSKDPSSHGSCSAGPSRTSRSGKRRRSVSAKAGAGSIADASAPRRTSSCVSIPVPAPTSRTRSPAFTPAKSAKTGASRDEKRPMKLSYAASESHIAGVSPSSRAPWPSAQRAGTSPPAGRAPRRRASAPARARPGRAHPRPGRPGPPTWIAGSHSSSTDSYSTGDLERRRLDVPQPALLEELAQRRLVAVLRRGREGARTDLPPHLAERVHHVHPLDLPHRRRDDPAGLRHARELAERGRSVVDEDDDELRERRVEGAVIPGKVGGGSLLDRGAGEAVAQHLDVVGGRLRGGHARLADARGKLLRQRARAAADVEHAHPRGHAREVRERGRKLRRVPAHEPVVRVTRAAEDRPCH